MKVRIYDETQATNLILKRKNNFQSVIFVFDEENKKEDFLILEDYIEDYINVLKFYGKKINNNTNEPIFDDFSINNILNIINNLTKFIKLPNDEKLKYIRDVENIDFNLENFILQVTSASYKKKDIDIWKNKFSFLEELLFNMEKSEILKNTNKYIYFFETDSFHYSGVKAEENGSAAGRSYLYFDENHRKLVKNNDLNEKNLILPTNKALKLYKEINSVEKKLFLLKDKNKSEERLKFLCSDEYKQIEEKKLKFELLKGNTLFYFPNHSYFEIKNKKSEEYINLIYKKKERMAIKNGQEYSHSNFHYSFN